MSLVRDSAIEDWCSRADKLIARGNRGILKCDDGVTAGEDRAGYLPSPEEIAAACREIQSGWSEEEEERRRAKRVPWAVPTCRVALADGRDPEA